MRGFCYQALQNIIVAEVLAKLWNYSTINNFRIGFRLKMKEIFVIFRKTAIKLQKKHELLQSPCMAIAAVK